MVCKRSATRDSQSKEPKNEAKKESQKEIKKPKPKLTGGKNLQAFKKNLENKEANSIEKPVLTPEITTQTQ